MRNGAVFRSGPIADKYYLVNSTYGVHRRPWLRCRGQIVELDGEGALLLTSRAATDPRRRRACPRDTIRN